MIQYLLLLLLRRQWLSQSGNQAVLHSRVELILKWLLDLRLMMQLLLLQM